MTVHEAPARSSARIAHLLARVKAVLRKPVAEFSWLPPRDIASELERLAAVSPHLLEDVGLAEDRTAGAPHRRVWTGRGLRVVGSREPRVGPVAVAHNPARDGERRPR